MRLYMTLYKVVQAAILSCHLPNFISCIRNSTIPNVQFEYRYGWAKKNWNKGETIINAKDVYTLVGHNNYCTNTL